MFRFGAAASLLSLAACGGGGGSSPTLTTPPPTLTSITISAPSVSIPVGFTTQFAATGTYSDGSSKAVSVTWSSTTPAVASISSAGLATGVAAGTTSITGASGSVTSPAVTLTITPQEYAYASNFGGGVSQYKVQSNGELAPLSTPTVAAGTQPFCVALTSTGTFAYVSNYNHDTAGGGTLSQYAIGAGGALTPLDTPTVPTGTGPSGVIVDPSNHYVYVANYGSNSVSEYSIGGDGALTPLSPAMVPAGTDPSAIAIDPSGHYLYVANFHSSSVSQYSIGSNGVLTPMNPANVAAGNGPNWIIATSKYVYVTNLFANTVSQYSIGSDGALTAQSPATVTAGSEPAVIAVSPNGSYAYVVNFTGNTVSQYTVGSTGALTAMSTPTVKTEIGPFFVSLDPTGSYAYVANRGTLTPDFVPLVPGTTLSQYSVGSDGSLTPLGTSTVAAGSGPTSVAITN